MKKLFVVVKNCGDGSTSVYATFDEALIDEIDDKYNSGDTDFDYETWADGDGFHYHVWTVPDECTADSMGFWELKREDVLS